MSEVTIGNINHIKNGREPNAGAAIFPTIPFVPLIILLITWGLNKLLPNLGFYLVIGLFLIYYPIWYKSFKQDYQKLENLKENS